jgi:hypothetical protein
MKTLKLFLLINFLVLSLFCAEKAGASNFDDIFEIDRAKLEIKRRAFVENKLTLSNRQKKHFWSLYEEYRADISKVDDRAIKLTKYYARLKNKNKNEISEKQAEKLLEGFLELDRKRVELKQLHAKRLNNFFSTKLVWRFFHIESNLDATINYAYISQIPIIEQDD